MKGNWNYFKYLDLNIISSLICSMCMNKYSRRLSLDRRALHQLHCTAFWYQTHVFDREKANSQVMQQKQLDSHSHNGQHYKLTYILLKDQSTL